MIGKLKFVLCAAALALSMSAQAGPIEQPTSTTQIQINAFEPVGQSFTAEDSAISFGFFFGPINPSFPNDPLQLQLLSGDGLGGSLLLSTTFSLVSGFTGYFDIDLSAISLIVGQMYTAVLSIPGSSPYWGMQIADNTNPYAGGRAYFTSMSFLSNDPTDDVRFRITPQASSVPEPGSLALLAVAAIGLGALRRRRSK